MGTRWLEWAGQGSQIVLLAGSALVAFGLTVLLVGAVQLLRTRRRAATTASEAADVEPSAVYPGAKPAVDGSASAVAAPRLRVDLGPLDRRLDEIDRRMQQLEGELDALRRAESGREVVRAAEVRSNQRSANTPEERALRELVARAR